MSLKSFLTYMKENDTRFTKILVLCVFILIVLVNVCFRIEKVRVSQVKQHNEQLQSLQKASDIQAEYEINKNALDTGILKRALKKDNVEVYQARLLKMLEGHNVQIQNITVLKSSQKEKQSVSANEYEANWIGTWKDVMNALKTMETEPIAINFSSIRIEASEDKEVIKANIKYKIYIIE